jgi:hypothetical protein
MPAAVALELIPNNQLAELVVEVLEAEVVPQFPQLLVQLIPAVVVEVAEAMVEMAAVLVGLE